MTKTTLIICVLLLLATTVNGQNQGQVRLEGQGSSALQGRVEIFYNGQWGTVCKDGFGPQEASVVCRQLNRDPVGARVDTSLTFGAGSGPIWLDSVECSGSETRLELCRSGGWGQHDCDHSEDVGVVCRPGVSPATTPATPATTTVQTGILPSNCTTPDPDIRLKGPMNQQGMGVVQVRKNGVWGGVCDDRWGTADAQVVCRMLCLDVANAKAGAEDFDTSTITEDMMLTNVQCGGNEASITDCPQSTWSAGACGRFEMAKVTCFSQNNSPPSRPEPILDCSGGKLTASFNKSRDAFLGTKHLILHNDVTGVVCNLEKNSAGNFVSIAIPFDECGTIATTNASHIIYSNTIRYLPTYDRDNATTVANTYVITVTCSFPRNITSNNEIEPLTETVTQKAPGQFNVGLNFFTDSSFASDSIVTQFPLEIPLGQYLSAALSLEQVESNLMLVVPRCYATPSANRDDPVSYPLFTNKCKNDGTLTFHPQNETMFGFRYQTFKFIEFSQVHIHCDAIVCRHEETSEECDRSCFPTTSGSNRRKRSASHPLLYVSSKPLYVYDPSNGPINGIIRPTIAVTDAPSQTTVTGRPGVTPATTYSSGTMTSRTSSPIETASKDATAKEKTSATPPLKVDVTLESETIIVDDSGGSGASVLIVFPLMVCVATLISLISWQ